MKLLYLKIFTAIQGGDLKSIKTIFEISTKEEVQELLSARQEEEICINRPSNGKKIIIKNATPMILAATGWYPEILDYLASFQQCLNLGSFTEDHSNNPCHYEGVTALHVACLAGKLKMVESLISHGADIDAQNTLGETGLFEASYEGHFSVVEYLLQKGGDLEISNNKSVTCLMISSFANNVRIMGLLDKNGVNAQRCDNDSRNALFYTVAGGDLETFQLLAKLGTKYKSDKFNINVLMEAVRHKKFDIITHLLTGLAEPPIDPKSKDSYGRNALFYAIEHESTEILDYLLKYGVPLAQSNDGRSLLHVSALNSNQMFLSYLLREARTIKLDINEKDDKGRNALFYCITGSNEIIFEYLISSGVRIDVSSDGITLLMQSVAKCKYDFAKYILENSSRFNLDINADDKDGWSALLYSVAGGHLELFELLISYGVDCHPATDGRTILMQASAKGDILFIQHILDHAQEYHVYINERDSDGWNALYYTVQGCHMKAFNYLISRGAKICAATNGATPLMEAVDKGKQEMVEYLIQNSKTLELNINHEDRNGASVLFYCAAGGHINLMKYLLNSGCDITVDNYGRNLLMQAALSARISVVQFLLNNIEAELLDIHKTDNYGKNVLFYAVESKDLSILSLLLNCGISSTADKQCRTLLMHACSVGCIEIVNFLLQLKNDSVSDINVKDSSGENALFYAVRSKNLDIVKLLISLNIEIACNDSGINMLSQTMSEGHDELVQAILSTNLDITSAVKGWDLNGRSIFHHCIDRGDMEMLQKLGKYYDKECDGDNEGVTSLMEACISGNITIVRFLVDLIKVDVHQTNKRKENALFYAIMYSKISIVSYMLNVTTLNQCDIDGKNVLMIAIENGRNDIIQTVLHSNLGKQTINICDNLGQNCCHYAAKLGNDLVVSLLINNSCTFNISDNEEVTPLMISCSNGHYLPTATFLKAGACVDDIDKQQQNALHYCFTKNSSLRCVKLLVNYDIDANSMDVNGVTPLMMACQNCSENNIPIITYLLKRGANPVLQDNNGKDSFDYCPFNADYVKAMLRTNTEIPEIEKIALEEFKNKLLEDVEINSVLRGLLKKKIFTKTLHFEVMKRPSTERVPKLLELLSARGNKAFRSLCLILKEDCLQQELAYCLQKAAYTVENEIFV